MQADFRILGPLEVRVDDAPLPLGGAKQRALLALLVLHEGEALSTDRLIDELWGDRPPPTAANTLQVHLSRLRKTLTAANGGAPLLLRAGDGYRLALDPEQLDRSRFERLVVDGRAALRAGRTERARELLEQALSLWRGPALADVAYEDFARGEIAALEELRVAALEDRIEAELELGRAAELVPELERLVRRHPLRERLRGQLMLALYRSGRQADALAAYQDARRTLHDELGLEPSPPLRELERAILAHDPALRRSSRPPGRQRRPSRRLAVAVAAGVVAAVTAVALTRAADDAPAGVGVNSLVYIDAASNRVSADVPLGSRPGAVAVGRGSVWVAGLDEKAVWRINPTTRAVEQRVSLAFIPSDVAVGAGAVWVAGPFSNEVIRIDPDVGEITPVGVPPTGRFPACFGGTFGRERYEIPDVTGLYPFRGTPAIDLVTARQLVWYVCSIGALHRIDPATNIASQVVYPGQEPRALAHGFRAVWVANRDGVARLDDVVGSVRQTIGLPGSPTSLAVGAGSVWAGAGVLRAVWRIGIGPYADPVSRAEKIDVGGRPERIAFGAGSVWVATTEGRVLRIDPATNRVVASIPVGHAPGGLAVGEGGVWVTTQLRP